MVIDYKSIVESHTKFFATRATYSLEFRIQQLVTLKTKLIEYIPEIKRALYQDLGRCDFEAGFDLSVIDTIDYFINNLPKWVEKQEIAPSAMQAPARVYIEKIPLGVCLIISPWNYPIELTIAPLLGAISAGNTAIIKTSEYSPNCAEILAQIINNHFPEHYLRVLTGDKTVSENLLKNKFDHIFYTGSTAVGRKIYECASKFLTPVVLELGGKSPCIIDHNVDYKQAARRIIFGKLINSGQTCVAPDYCLISSQAYNHMIAAFKEVLLEFYPNGALNSNDFSKIISKRHMFRLEHIISQQQSSSIICGGEVDYEHQKISPTLLSFVDVESSLSNIVMQEEIFGPILPLIKYDNIEQIFYTVAKSPQPLALYIFSKSHDFCHLMMNSIQSGGVCINDIMVHLFNLECGFGGIGSSGLGSYHGELSFKTYSHERTVAVRDFHVVDPLNARFPPYHN
jgi:aldehyde dehydrogenase (NAD+)